MPLSVTRSHQQEEDHYTCHRTATQLATLAISWDYRRWGKCITVETSVDQLHGWASWTSDFDVITTYTLIIAAI